MSSWRHDGLKPTMLTYVVVAPQVAFVASSPHLYIQLCLCWVLPPAQHSSSFFSWKEKKAQSASLVFLLSEFLHLFLVSFCGNWRLVVDQRWTNYMLWKPLHLLLCSASHFTAGTKVQTICGPVQTWGAEHQIWPMQSIFERVVFF